jgi:glutamate-1-semialdehyde 2,1-aminomutase
VTGIVQRAGSMLALFFSGRPVRCFKDAQATEARRFAAFFHAMLARGFHLPPSRFEAWFVSLAHTEEIIRATVAAAEDALAEIASSSKERDPRA